MLTMSGGQRQMVACARAIAFESKILIMDEPTAALGVTEANKLLGLIRNLADNGLSILLITQRIPDILAIADRVFVLKGGHASGVLDVGKVTLDDVVTLIVEGQGQTRCRSRSMSSTSRSDESAMELNQEPVQRQKPSAGAETPEERSQAQVNLGPEEVRGRLRAAWLGRALLDREPAVPHASGTSPTSSRRIPTSSSSRSACRSCSSPAASTCRSATRCRWWASSWP